MRLYILLLLTVYINTNIYSQIKPKITTNQISNLLVDSTRLENDSILVYYQNGIIIGRDTISGTGGSVGGVTGSGTTNEIAYFTGATTLGSLATATYPSLTELSYVKGVTSAIQTQLNGKQATLTNPVTGTGNSIFIGVSAGQNDDGTTNQNVGIGFSSMALNTTGSNNTALGYVSLFNLNGGTKNIAIGANAGRFRGSSTGNLTSADNSIFIGVESRASDNGNSNEIVIGNEVIGNGSNSVTIGNNGTLGTATSKTILNGNVGIGITNPLNRLHIRSTGSADTYQLLLESDSETTGSRAGINIATVKSTGGVISPFLRFDLGSNYTTKTHSASFGIYGNNADGGYTEYMWIGVANKDSYNNAAMKIDSLGRVGINILTTNLPTSTLDVNGNTNITGKLLLNDATSSIYVGSNNATTATTANSNLGVGNNALLSLTTGDDNIAIGTDASYTLTTGIQNISIGKGAATGATSSINNIAIGNLTLNVSNGESNIGIGTSALGSATTGNNNIAIGHYAGQNHSSATESIYIGKSTTGTSAATNEMVIGSNAVGQGTNTTVINSTSTVRTTIQGDTLVVPKFLNVDTATLFVDAVNNRVGIGTRTPNAPLETYISSGGVVESARFGGNVGYAYFNNYGDLVGIYGSVTSSLSAAYTGNTAGFGTQTNSNMVIYTNSVERIRIKSSGEVGIGTTNPLAKLSIKGGFALTDPTVGNGSITSDNPLVYIYDDSQTSSGATDAEFSFIVAGQGSVSASQGPIFGMRGKNFSRFSDARGRVEFYAAQGITSPTGTDGTILFTTNGGSLTVEYDGDVVMTDNAYIQGTTLVTSDINLKNNINDYYNGLDKILNLRPVSFYLNNDKDNILNFGFIAQDVEEILPELVRRNNNTGSLYLNYDNFIPIIVNGIKEQQAIIETQQTKITTLENTINQLIQRIELLENN